MTRSPAPSAGSFSTPTEPATASEQTADAHPVDEPRQRRPAISAVLAAMVLVVLNTAIVNMALPTIAQALNVPPALSVWIITANQAALLMALLPCAALGESLGYRRVFRCGVALFLAATLMGALAPTLPWLIAARLLQGLAANGAEPATGCCDRLECPCGGPVIRSRPGVGRRVAQRGRLAMVVCHTAPVRALGAAGVRRATDGGRHRA